MKGWREEENQLMEEGKGNVQTPDCSGHLLFIAHTHRNTRTRMLRRVKVKAR